MKSAMSNTMERIKEIQKELQDMLVRLNELYKEYPALFQFVFFGIVKAPKADDGEEQVMVLEGFHVHADNRSARVMGQLFNLNAALMWEQERWKMWMNYDSFMVVCRATNTELEEGMTPKVGGKYTVTKHAIDRENHAILFEIRDEHGEEVRSTIEGFHGAFPSLMFIPDEAKMASLN